MKFFAIAAIMATASAVRLSAKTHQGAPSWEDVLAVLDSDGNQKVSWPEIEDFIAEMEEQYGEKMPKEMKKDIKEMFDLVDTDGSGEIDKAEFEAAVAAHGALGQKARKGFAQLTTRQGPSWEDVLEVLDADGNGKVSWPEIEGFIAEMEQQYGEKMPKEMKKEIKDMFDMVDTDGSGEIDKAEFEAAVAAHGALGQKARKGFAQILSRQGAPSWEDVLAVLDADGNQKVSWGEIEAFIAEMEEQYGEKMPKDMKKEIKNMFDMVDTDGSGEIDKAEFEAAVAAHGALGQKTRKGFAQLLAKQGAPSWEDVLEVLDADGNQKVSWGEIEAFIAEMEEQYGEKMPKDMKKEIKKMFDMVDADGSGEIDKAEFEAAVAAHGALGQKTRRSFKKLVQMKSKQGAPSWEDVLAVLDADGSGTVSWDEIVAFIKQIEEEHGVKISKEDKKAIKAAFEQVDADGSGDIDKAEFEAAVAAMEGLAQLKKYM